MRGRPRKQKPGLPNLRLDPVPARTVTGEAVTVDRSAGRFFLMLSRSGWPRELVEACQRFEHDFQFSRSGLRGAALSQRVDGGQRPETSSRIDAAGRLRRIEAACDKEEFAILTLGAGLGMTLSQISARGWGQKDELGRVLRRAASHAAGVYQAGYVAPLSSRLREMQKFIADATRDVR